MLASQAWTTYVRGNVVSEHASRIIKQSMAACCGKSSRTDKASDGGEDAEAKTKEMPRSAIPLERVHAILDRMSSGQHNKKKKNARRKVKKKNRREEVPTTTTTRRH